MGLENGQKLEKPENSQLRPPIAQNFIIEFSNTIAYNHLRIMHNQGI
jgi:hypothetical protein